MAGAPTFYTITDKAFFVGTAALLNSLRLTGNDGELVVLDCGLTEGQRDRLAVHCKVIPAERVSSTTGVPIKPFAWPPDADGTVVLIDSDMLVTAPLDPVVADAGQGRIVSFVDQLAVLSDLPNRRFQEWQSLLGLKAPVRDQLHLNAGLIAFSVSIWPHLIDRWRELAGRALELRTRDEFQRLRWFENPFSFVEQDSFNALLMSEVPADSVAAYDQALAPVSYSRQAVDVQDVSGLRCVHVGRQALLLHHIGKPKPWHRRAWAVQPFPSFVRLLPRVLFSEDVPLRLDRSDVPPWLRSGPGGGALRVGATSLRTGLRWGSRLMPSGVRKHARARARDRVVGGVLK